MKRPWQIALIGALAAAALSLAACDEEPLIALYPVELVEPVPEDPFETDPLLSPGPLDCGDCRERRVVLAGGDVVTIRAAQQPALRLAEDEVAFVELADAAVGESAAGESAVAARFGVYAVLEPAGREAWSALAAAHANRLVLVELAGRPVDLIRPLGWTRGLRIGVFANESHRTAFLETLPFAPPVRPGHD